jgi:hypothetical protein
MLPEVNEKASAIYDVLLPGFYRERTKKWKGGIAAFRKSAAQFNAAVKGTNDQALLDAAENLHANYEMLFRILHPVPKSIEYFHKLLYVVYHDYYPNDKYDELKTAAVELKNRSDSIATQLGRAGISAGKKKAAKEILALQNACDALIKECAKEKPDYNEAVDRVHAAYQKLEARYN